MGLTTIQYNARKAAGRCVTEGCRESAVPEYVHCAPCAERRRISQAQRAARGRSLRGDPADDVGATRRWRALSSEMATPCDRCGLRGEHECLKNMGVARQEGEAIW